MDPVDKQCRNWARCYKCINIDDEDCHADHQDYTVDFIPFESRFAQGSEIFV